MYIILKPFNISLTKTQQGKRKNVGESCTICFQQLGPVLTNFGADARGTGSVLHRGNVLREKVWSNLLRNLKRPLRKKKNNNKNKNCVSSICHKMPWNSHAETSNRTFLKKDQRLRTFASTKTPWGQRRGVHMQTSFRLALGNLQRFL